MGGLIPQALLGLCWIIPTGFLIAPIPPDAHSWSGVENVSFVVGNFNVPSESPRGTKSHEQDTEFLCGILRIKAND